MGLLRLISWHIVHALCRSFVTFGYCLPYYLLALALGVPLSNISITLSKILNTLCHIVAVLCKVSNLWELLLCGLEFANVEVIIGSNAVHHLC